MSALSVIGLISGVAADSCRPLAGRDFDAIGNESTLDMIKAYE